MDFLEKHNKYSNKLKQIGGDFKVGDRILRKGVTGTIIEIKNAPGYGKCDYTLKMDKKNVSDDEQIDIVTYECPGYETIGFKKEFKLIPLPPPPAKFEINDIVRVNTENPAIGMGKRYNFEGRLAEIKRIEWIEDFDNHFGMISRPGRVYWYYIKEYDIQNYQFVENPYEEDKLELVCKNDKRIS